MIKKEFNVTGMTCAACQANVEKTIKKLPGVESVSVNLLNEKMSVSFDEKEMTDDIIINTVPHMILTKERLENVKQECLLIDLASNPGGMDKKAIKDRNLKFVWALSLPGKVAPTTSAEFIKDTIYNIMKEITKEDKIWKYTNQ